MKKREKTSQFFWKIWEYVLIIWHIIFILNIIISLITENVLGIITSIILIIASWILSFIFVVVEDKKNKKYQKKHTKQIKIENTFLGTCIFEEKPNEYFIRLIEYNKEIKFGTYSPKILYKGNNTKIYKALEELEKIYKDADDILDEIYTEALNICQVWKETGVNNSIIDFDYIKKYCKVSQIKIENDEKEIIIYITSYIYNEEDKILLGDHDLVAEINCNTNEIDIKLEG